MNRKTILLTVGLAFLFSIRADGVGQVNPAGGRTGLPAFAKSSQVFPGGTFQIAAADLDGDGDQDAVFSGTPGPSHVFLNDGKGAFRDSGQAFRPALHGVAIGDLDGDGDPDLVFAAVHSEQASPVYINDGRGRFVEGGGSALGSGIAVFLIDLEKDGDLDVVLERSGGNSIYLNDGKAHFTRSGPLIPGYAGFGDLNGDGFADWLVSRGGKGFEVSLNDRKGNFPEPGLFPKPDLISRFHALADLDADGDNDVIYSNGEGEIRPSGILWNDGKGQLSESGQILARVETGRIGTGDLNGDGFVDLLFADRLRPAQIWLNDGKGRFFDSGARLDESGACHGFALADFDGDGDLDVFIANFLNPKGNSGLWFNQLREKTRR